MIFYYFLALLAAFCWSISSLISADITRVLGGIGFNRLRLIFVSFMLLIYASLQNSWNTINIEYLNIIIVSGVIGIFLGDTLLFMAMQRIGPRRNNILFSLAAPFTVILNIVALQKGGSDGFTFEQLIKCSELSITLGKKIREIIKQATEGTQ